MTRRAVLCVFGTRPEAIKMAPVVRKLMEFPREFRTDVLVSAQHREMLDQVLSLFRIRPRWDLNLMKSGQTLTEISAGVLTGLAPILRKRRPDLVLVQGDTTTTFAAATAAFYHGIPVGHVEAGLRSGDPAHPFPEELNRRMTDDLSSLHFAPTLSAKRNLLRENIRPGGIFVTGNTGIDALKMGLSEFRPSGRGGKARFSFAGSGHARALKSVAEKLGNRPFILLTAHRRENFGAPLRELFGAVKDVAKRREDVHFVYPVHPNPNVTGAAREILGGVSNVHLLPPLDYADFIPFLREALFVVTDSGGLQEEAPSLGKPVLVLRKVTERPEAVDAGTVRLVGTEGRSLHRWILALLDDRRLFQKMANAVNPYGDGLAAERTVQAIRFHFNFRRGRPKDFA